jgi:hypothetical protein
MAQFKFGDADTPQEQKVGEKKGEASREQWEELRQKGRDAVDRHLEKVAPWLVPFDRIYKPVR